MAEVLEPKHQILRQWLEDPAIEHTLRALGRRTGLRHLPLMRAMAELIQHGVIAVRPNTHPAIFHLTRGTLARDALKAVHETKEGSPLSVSGELPPIPLPTEKQPATFASFLRQQRGLNGLSRGALADRTGVSEDILAKIEQSQAAPSRAQIHLLAQHLHLSETDLLAKAGYMGP